MTPASLIISPRESIASIIDRALLLDAPSIVIIVPEDADIAQSMVSLKIIHQELSDSKKKISWKSTSEAYQKVLDRTFTPQEPSRAPNTAIITEPTEEKRLSKTLHPIEKEPTGQDDVLNAKDDSSIPGGAQLPPRKKIGVEKDEAPEQPLLTSSSPREPRSSRLITRSRAVIFTFVAGALAIGSFVAIAPRAEITIVPKSEPFIVDLEVAASPTPGPEDISLRWEEVSVSVTETIDTTGKTTVKTKARGPVSLSNIYSTTTMTVPAGALFTDDRGETYLLETAIAVPGMTIVGPKRDPGKASGTIIAQNEGEKGNRGAGSLTMSYPGYDSASADDFTATTSGLLGGTEIEKKIVSSEDKRQLTERLNQAFLDQVSSEIEPLRDAQETYLPLGWIIAGDKTEFSAAEGEEAEDLTSLRSATVSVGLFRHEDAQEALTQLLNKRRGDDRLFIAPPQFALKLVIVDSDRRRLILGWHVDTLVSAPVNTAEIIDRVRGKNPAEVEALRLDDALFIKRISVRLWPFWVKSVPSSTKRIELIITPS